MADATGPIIWVVGGDPLRFPRLNPSLVRHWPRAQVIPLQLPLPASLAPLLRAGMPVAVFVAVDFATEAAAAAGLEVVTRMLRTQPSLHCIVLAEHGDERAAVRALKCGAKDYLPAAQITHATLSKMFANAGPEVKPIVTGTADSWAGPRHPAGGVPGYALRREIASSNFSSVFLARSERFGGDVALKIMSRGSSPRELEDAERFRHEYDIISSISHRAIADIYEHGMLPDHQYLAMEYLPGGALRDRLRNPLSIDESLYYLRAIAEALRVIHAFGITHRDLKPANVMLREDASPVLIDFGLARRTLDDAGTTGAGQVLGSPYYISPEQSQGFKVDARTDLYSLGVMFHEMLTGARPYTGRSAMAIMAQHAGAPVPKLPHHVARQQALLDRLMAKRLAERYASADQLLADLGPVTAAATGKKLAGG